MQTFHNHLILIKNQTKAKTQATDLKQFYLV